MAYNKVNQGPAAMNAVNESLRHDTKFEDAYCCRGKLYLKEGEYQKAENDYKATIKLNNRSWMALSGMADCYRMKSQYQSAIKYYDRSLAALADATVELYQNE
jgi:tetratricopeptide (TPR) repeat protein